MQDWTQVVDIAGDLDILSRNSHIIRKPLKSSGPKQLKVKEILFLDKLLSG